MKIQKRFAMGIVAKVLVAKVLAMMLGAAQLSMITFALACVMLMVSSVSTTALAEGGGGKGTVGQTEQASFE